MARTRTIKPEFFRSRSLARVPLAARLTFVGLWCEADDYGRGVADPRILKGAIWPLDDDVDAAQVEEHLQQLADTGHIVVYAIDGDVFYAISTFDNHQSAAYRRGQAKYPEPTPDTILHTFARDGVQAAHLSVQAALKGSTDGLLEGKGTEGKGVEPHAHACSPDHDPEHSPTSTPVEPQLNGHKAAPAAPAKPRTRGTRIADPFVVSDDMVAWAEAELPGFDWVRETVRFKDHWLAAPGAKGVKQDWPATWRNWMRRAAEGAFR
jgi:hypothetical protein